MTWGKDPEERSMDIMQKTYALLDIDLQLFDGAAGGAAAGGAAAGEGSAQGEASALPKAVTGSGSSRRSKAGAYDNVVFGKQEDAPKTETATPDAGENAEGNGNKSGVTTTSDSKEAKQKAFRDLIEGEYKEQYTDEFNNYFNRRFKEVKGMENSLNAQKPIMDLLMQRYNIADGDIGKLKNALDNDNVYWEDAAEEAGMTVEQYKEVKRLEQENAELKRIRQQQIGEQQANQKLNQWYAEAEKVKELYPTFDFRTESQDRDFLGLLKSGLSVQQAYELKHMDEIKTNAARAAAQTAGQQMVAKIQNKASRPTENGTSSQSAVIVKNDVHNLSRAERAEIARRVQRGEKIRF